MAYTETVIQRATTRLDERRLDRQTRQEDRRRAVYARLPELREIDRNLQQSIPQVLAAAMRRGEDPRQAVAALREQNLKLQQKRVDLLRGAGFSAEEGEDIPFCPHCDDSGWSGATMCSCLKTLCAEEQIKELSSLLKLGDQSFARFRLDYYAERFWPDYGRSPRENMEKILAFCQQYAAQFGSKPIRSLLFYGGTGLGKTFLSACIAREVAEGGASVVYEGVGAILGRFEEQKFSRDLLDAREAKDETRRYLRCDLLIVDDLGSEMTTPFVQAALYQLINSRLVEGRATIISTNFTMETLRGRYSPQIVSRLEGEYEALPFFGEDIRLLKKQ